MITHRHTVAGDECLIHFPERRADLEAFRAFLARGDKLLAVDTETTGLDVFSPGFELRLVQFGTGREAWVLRADLFADEIRRALRQDRMFVGHNLWPFDGLVLDHALGVTLEELSTKALDTRILAHLLDPRDPGQGGAGLSLKPLSAIYVDPDAPDTQEGLHKVFRTIRHPETGKLCTKDNGWRWIPIDHPTYVTYAGLDVILTHRLFGELAPLVKDLSLEGLSKFEHHLAVLLAIMQRRGMLLDVGYVHTLADQLERDQLEHEARAARYGVEKVGSPAQVRAALLAMGETWTEKTDSGELSTAKEVLLPLADLDRDWHRIDARDPNPLADAVLRAKRAGKWRTSYAQAFLDLKDEGDRLHPFISGLAARTARMSVSRPPLQQLPSSDWTIRRAFVADPGQVMISVDYQAVEMRVLAALCQDETMVQAILDGVDLHTFTTERVFGLTPPPPKETPEYEAWKATPAAKEWEKKRKVSKAVGFGKVYGGGVTTVVRQTGADPTGVKAAMAAYDQTFPGIKQYGRRLQKRAQFGKLEVITPAGRHLPLDRDRIYAATNAVVQSTSRDLLAQALVDLYDAGLGDHLLMPIHDEILAQAPADDAEDVAREIGRLMSSDFIGVPITTDPEVGGRSWGSLYGASE